LIGKAGHAFAQRSAGGPPGSQISVYLADTLGEMGLWYRLAPLTFLAGSLGNTGGHNPFEAAQLGTAILHGPNVVNAAPAYAALAEAGATQMVETAAQLGAAITTLLSEPSLLAARKSAATGVAMATDVTIAPVVNSLLTLLDRA
ncbi:MAG: 3-deoxy-D-manno-octulosonic acid transferase, partial [Rhodobacteraceae bacterium]|nr:3-deoxy-D-manno-octulosonic acid transferase [Paracoccaceae bacterium]